MVSIISIPHKIQEVSQTLSKYSNPTHYLGKTMFSTSEKNI